MTSSPHIKGVALMENLRILHPYLNRDGVTEIVINQPGWISTFAKT